MAYQNAFAMIDVPHFVSLKARDETFILCGCLGYMVWEAADDSFGEEYVFCSLADAVNFISANCYNIAQHYHPAAVVLTAHEFTHPVE